VLLVARGSGCKPTSKALGAALGANTAVRNALQTGCDSSEESCFGIMAFNKPELKPLFVTLLKATELDRGLCFQLKKPSLMWDVEFFH